MSDTQNTTTTADAMEGGKTFTQEDVNRIVADRLKRAKADAAEMDELRKKAAELDEIKAAQQTDLEKAQKAYADAAAELERMKADAARTALVNKVAAEKDVPASLLKGATEDELAASADAIVEFARKQTGFPTDKGGAASAKPVTREAIEKMTDPVARVRARAENINLYQ